MEALVDSLMKIAKGEQGNSGDKTLRQEVSDAIHDLEVEVRQAEVNAKKISWSNMSARDKKDFENAEHLLRHARSTTNPEHARKTYLHQLKKTIDRINKRNKYEDHSRSSCKYGRKHCPSKYRTVGGV